jgi:hypothetical protein
LTYSFQAHYDLGVDSACNGNEYQELFPGADNLTTFMCRLPTSWKLRRTSRPCTGIELPLIPWSRVPLGKRIFADLVNKYLTRYVRGRIHICPRSALVLKEMSPVHAFPNFTLILSLCLRLDAPKLFLSHTNTLNPYLTHACHLPLPSHPYQPSCHKCTHLATVFKVFDRQRNYGIDYEVVNRLEYSNLGLGSAFFKE